MKYYEVEDAVTGALTYYKRISGLCLIYNGVAHMPWDGAVYAVVTNSYDGFGYAAVKLDVNAEAVEEWCNKTRTYNIKIDRKPDLRPCDTLEHLLAI